jgi:hypothetical protein
VLARVAERLAAPGELEDLDGLVGARAALALVVKWCSDSQTESKPSCSA